MIRLHCNTSMYSIADGPKTINLAYKPYAFRCRDAAGPARRPRSMGYSMNLRESRFET